MLRSLRKYRIPAKARPQQMMTEKQPRQTALFEIATWSILLFVIIFIRHRSYLLAPNMLAYGDFGANALQVQNAKHFRELLGNYSRWGFHHPGPALFYWYALFETILPRLSPIAAEIVGGMVLQILLILTALSMTGRHLKLRAFLPIAVAVLSVHLSFTESGLTSIWPPHILIGIFLSFALFAILVADGSTKALPFFVMCCCLLVHGHVAQPMFVVPIFTLSTVLWFRQNDGDRLKAHLATSAVILAVFILPILIDLTKGADSNFARIIEHIKEHSGEAQSIRLAIIELPSFLLYPDSQHFTWPTYWPTLLVYPSWALLCVLLLKLTHTRWSARYVGLTAVLIILSIVWSYIQDGEPRAYNAFFDLAIIFLMAIPAIVLAATYLHRIKYIGLASATLAILAWVNSQPIFAPVEDGGSVISFLHKHLDGSKTVFLNTDIGPERWNQAVAVANYLVRAGVKVRVEDKNYFLLSSLLRRRNEDDYFKRPGLKIVNVDSTAPAREYVKTSPGNWGPPTDFISVSDDVTTVLPPVLHIGDTLTRRTINKHLSYGFYSDMPEQPFVWTARKAKLIFRTIPADRDVRISIDVIPFLGNNSLPYQTLRVLFDNDLSWEGNIKERMKVQFSISPELWTKHAVSSLNIVADRAMSPKHAGVSNDARIIGVGIVSITAD